MYADQIHKAYTNVLSKCSALERRDGVVISSHVLKSNLLFARGRVASNSESAIEGRAAAKHERDWWR